MNQLFSHIQQEVFKKMNIKYKIQLEKRLA